MLKGYPLSDLVSIVSEVGFRCDRCARCCTRAFNGHVLLLDEDAIRIRSCEAGALEPVPALDFCDQNGIFYTSGYTIRTLGDVPGSCYFLEDRRCRIYEKRPAICRVYPYMLHREPDEEGNLDWRQVSGLDQHGEYHTPISEDEVLDIAVQSMAFEEAVLAQEIAYLDYTARYFLTNNLRHVRKKYDDGLRRLLRGESIEVMVYCRHEFERWVVSDASPGEPGTRNAEKKATCFLRGPQA